MKNGFRILTLLFFALQLSAIEITPAEPPTYPEAARINRVQGDVTLQVEFGKLGSVIRIIRQSAYPVLGKRAKNEIWKWRFSGTSEGQKVVVVFQYRLKESAQGTTVKFSKDNRKVTIIAPPIN